MSNAPGPESCRSPSLYSPIGRRGALAAAGGAIALGGCNFVQKSPFFSTVATFNQSAGAKIDRAKVDSIPYATLLGWFDGNQRALLVLGEYKPEGRLVWYSAEQQVMTTWGAFVLGLVGLDVSLRATTLVGQWDANPSRLVGKALKRSLDFDAVSGRTTVSTTSSFSDAGLESVNVFDRRLVLRRIRERVVADRWHHYSNDYWVEETTGICWRSRQIVVPTMPAFNIVLTKPAKPVE